MGCWERRPRREEAGEWQGLAKHSGIGGRPFLAESMASANALRLDLLMALVVALRPVVTKGNR